ncbi:hypothetical protein [Corallococcus sp. AB018]|uniref:hypothetical protein n=1 Tax=Corallococcus sp. AB018 TaxID=2316715 RepID=UPI000F875707|nr:hypothetical protein [Corallococcus sp. AB018]
MATKMIKRALMAVDGLPDMRPNPGRMELAPNVYLATDWPLPPITIPTIFATPYGTDALEPLDAPNLVVWAEQEVSDTVIGAVDQELERKLELVDIALSMLPSWGTARRVITVELIQPDSQRQLQGLSTLHPWFARESWWPLHVDFHKLPAITSRLIDLTAPGWERNEFFVRGIRSFFRACQQDMVDDRYELFCRSIETVVQSEQGKGQDQFAEAILLQQGRLNPNKPHRNRAYERHYRRRNDVVHGHRFLEEKKDRRAIALMEGTARRFFQELLINEQFFETISKAQSRRLEAKRVKEQAKRLKQQEAKRDRAHQGAISPR